MADRKITDLTALAAGSQATGDLLTIVDVSESAAADKNKKITMENLFKGIPGDVGIGTSAPGAPLTVFGGSASSPTIRIEGGSSGNDNARIESEFNLILACNGDGDQSDRKIQFRNSNTDLVTIDSSGNLGIGDTTPDSPLHVKNSANTVARFESTDSITRIVLKDNSGESRLGTDGDNITFHTSSSENERVRINSNGKLLVGHSSATDVAAIQSQIQVIGADAATGSIAIRRDQNVASGPLLVFGKSRSGSRGGNTAVQANDTIGAVLFNAADGTDVTTSAARIKAEVDGTPGSNDMPGRLILETTADGASSLTERVRIDSSGRVGIGETNPGHQLTVKGTGSNSAIANFYGGTVGRGLVISTSNDGGTGDDTVIYNATQNSGNHVFQVDADEKARIDSNGRLCLGASTSDVLSTFTLSSTNAYSSTGNVSGDNVGLKLYNSNGTDGTGVDNYSGLRFQVGSGAASIGHLAYERTADNKGDFVFNQRTGASSYAEAVRITNAGRLLVGTSSSQNQYGSESYLQVVGDGFNSSTIALRRDQSNANPPGVIFAKSRSSSVGGNTIVQNSDAVGSLYFAAADGSDLTSLAAQIKVEIDGTPGSNDTPGRIMLMTTADGSASPSEAFNIRQNGEIESDPTYSNTTAGAANVHITSSGFFARSTSSEKYKTNIETLEDSYADAILDIRPVWYRSTCEKDNSEHGWWGFIAEEVAAVDPRLVHWKTVEVSHDEDGRAVKTPCDPEPEGVAYDRFVPHLLNLIKRQQSAIETLEAKVAALEAQ